MNKEDLDLIHWLKHIVPTSVLGEIESSIKEKPHRISNAYKELLSGYQVKDASEILSVTEILENNYSGLVSVTKVPFLSFCVHHFLPFTGSIDLIYDPGEFILGIGKLSRLIDYRTKRFIIQENIAKSLCEDLINFGKAKGSFVRVIASHTCACYRGPSKFEAKNTVIYKMGTCSDKNMISQIDTIIRT